MSAEPDLVAMAMRMHDVQYERANRIEAERDAALADQLEWLKGLRAAAGEPPVEPWLLAAIQERMKDLNRQWPMLDGAAND